MTREGGEKVILLEAVEQAKMLLIRRLSETEMRMFRIYLGRMVSVIELCEALDQEIEDLRRRRGAGVGPFYGEPKQLVVRTVADYELNLEVIHVVEIEMGNSYIVKVWEKEGKVYPSRVVEGRIKFLGSEQEAIRWRSEHRK